MHLWEVSLAGDSGSLIGRLSVTFGGTPNFDLTNSLDGAYLGPFINLIFPNLIQHPGSKYKISQPNGYFDVVWVSNLYLTDPLNCCLQHQSWCTGSNWIQVFPKLTTLVITRLLRENKNIQSQNVTPSGIESGPLITPSPVLGQVSNLFVSNYNLLNASSLMIS